MRNKCESKQKVESRFHVGLLVVNQHGLCFRYKASDKVTQNGLATLERGEER